LLGPACLCQLRSDGMSNRRLFEFTGDDPAHTSFALACRDILLNGQRPIIVIGPLLEDEATQAHSVKPQELISETGR
jgi:hypothetical protein